MKKIVMTKNIVAFGADRKKGQIIIVDDDKYLREINLCLNNNWCQQYFDRVADDIITTQQIKNKRRGRNKK